LNTDGLLTVGRLKKILSKINEEAIICVAGSAEITIFKDEESKVNPEMLCFDCSDFDPGENEVIFTNA